MNYKLLIACLTLIPFLSVAVTPAAFANEYGLSEQYLECMDHVLDLGAFVNTRRIACAKIEFNSKYSELNATYYSGLTKLPSINKKNLIASQKIWYKYFESFCKPWIGLGAAPNDEANFMLCKAEESFFRMQQLKIIIDSYEK